MPGLSLGIGETNPKRGAVQFDARRIDGVKFVIPTAAGVTSAPIGSVVTLQENSAGKQIIVLGAAAYEARYRMSIQSSQSVSLKRQHKPIHQSIRLSALMSTAIMCA